MNTRSSLLFLLLCGFAELKVSAQSIEMLEGKPYTLKMKTNTNEKPTEVKWIHESGALIQLKNGKIKKNGLEASLEDDGSLSFKKISVNNSGKYTYSAFNGVGTEIGSGEERIKVYPNILNVTVKYECGATLTCDPGVKDQNITWFKENIVILNEKKPTLILTSSQMQENKQYWCNASNLLSFKLSNKVTVPCSETLFGVKLWIMVSILSSGAALLLLLICVLIICGCRSCQHNKRQQDEAELRLQNFHESGNCGTNRSKQTARGQPAPPIPQEEPINGSPSPQSTPPVRAQPKAQTRARPPPPPQDEDGEDPPPLPRPRNKQRNKKNNQVPYRPME